MLAPLTALAAMVQAIALAAPSTTTLSLSTSQSAYGQSVTATAAVPVAPRFALKASPSTEKTTSPWAGPGTVATAAVAVTDWP